MSRLTAVQELAVRPVAALHRLMADPSRLVGDVRTLEERDGHPRRPLEAALAAFLVGYPEFRNIYYYRLAQEGGRLRILAAIARRMWKPLANLDIACDDIGPGLVISHGHGTILTPSRIGARCWVHHEVTVGWSRDGGRPVVGDDVFIGVGAKVLGAITIGDGARIGANAVVVKDVPAGATAVGVPARIIERQPEA